MAVDGDIGAHELRWATDTAAELEIRTRQGSFEFVDDIPAFIDLEATVRKFNPKTRFVLTGSRSEKTLGRMFRQKSRYVIDLVGETGVLDLVALMKYLKAIMWEFI